MDMIGYKFQRFGAGLIFWIAANWQDQTRMFKLMLYFLLVVLLLPPLSIRVRLGKYPQWEHCQVLLIIVSPTVMVFG